MVHEQGGRHRLRELGRRIRLDPHAALLEHHVALGRDHRLLDQEVRHAVGLERHHGAEVLAGDALEIGGVVVGGEGVLLAAEAGHDLRELAGRVLLRALEHQVLEEVGDARLAERIIRRAIAIPDHVGHDGHAVIGDHHHFEAVVERERGHLGPAAFRSPERGRIGSQIELGGGVQHGDQPWRNQRITKDWARHRPIHDTRKRSSAPVRCDIVGRSDPMCRSSAITAVVAAGGDRPAGCRDRPSGPARSLLSAGRCRRPEGAPAADR